MLKKWMFHVVMVGEGHGVGVEATAQADVVVKYTGKTVVVRFGI
jgi:hypothetical protein